MNDPLLKQVLITESEISAKVSRLAEQISDEHEGKDLLLINVLKGGVVFLSDLMRALTCSISVDFMAVSSYGPATQQLGIVRLLKDLDENIYDRNVLIVEDIVDTGLTLNYLYNNLMSRKPRQIQICTLLDKPARRIADIPLDHIGFEIEDKFVVGYGLDHNERYRNLPDIYELDVDKL